MSNELDRLCRFRVLSPQLDFSGKLLSFTSAPFLQTSTSAHVFILQPSGKSPFIKRSVLIFRSFTAIGTSSPLSAASIWVYTKKSFQDSQQYKKEKKNSLYCPGRWKTLVSTQLHRPQESYIVWIQERYPLIFIFSETYCKCVAYFFL